MALPSKVSRAAHGLAGPRGSTAGVACVLLIALSIVLLHLFGPRSTTGALWGANLWAFLPPWAFRIAAALVAFAGWPLFRGFVTEVAGPRAPSASPVSGQDVSTPGGASTRARRSSG